MRSPSIKCRSKRSRFVSRRHHAGATETPLITPGDFKSEDEPRLQTVTGMPLPRAVLCLGIGCMRFSALRFRSLAFLQFHARTGGILAILGGSREGRSLRDSLPV